VDEGFFPLDERLGLDSGSLSPGLAKVVVWLSGQLSYEQVCVVMERIGGIGVARSTVWECVQKHGKRLVAFQRHQQGQVSLERTRWEHQRYQALLRKGVSMDGGMVNIPGEGWKEMKVGLVYSLLEPAFQDEREAAPVCHDLHYTAVLGGVEQFSPALWALAVQNAIPYAGYVAVTADGAPWIWNLSADLFPTSTQIVDYYHAAQHLAAAAQARFPTDALAAKRWTDQLKTFLLKDEVWKIIDALSGEALDDFVAYFDEHRYRMLYATFRAQGYPIGSGATESTVKQYKQRFCGPGMRWSRPGAHGMIVIRSAVLDDSFDRLWQAA